MEAIAGYRSPIWISAPAVSPPPVNLGTGVTPSGSRVGARGHLDLSFEPET